MTHHIVSKLALTLTLIMVYTSSHAQQVCNPNMVETAPASRFTVNANQTVTDQGTGLMWKRCSEGQSGLDCSIGLASGFGWQEALLLANASTFAGYDDWRLPNIKELLSITEFACFSPPFNLTTFPNTPGDRVGLFGFWSSSPAGRPTPNTIVGPSDVDDR